VRQLLALALVLASLSVQAQPARIRGVVESFDGKMLTVKDAGSVAGRAGQSDARRKESRAADPGQRA
jgi:hypothetical protein